MKTSSTSMPKISTISRFYWERSVEITLEINWRVPFKKLSKSKKTNNRTVLEMMRKSKIKDNGINK